MTARATDKTMATMPTTSVVKVWSSRTERSTLPKNTASVALTNATICTMPATMPRAPYMRMSNGYFSGSSSCTYARLVIIFPDSAI